LTKLQTTKKKKKQRENERVKKRLHEKGKISQAKFRAPQGSLGRFQKVKEKKKKAKQLNLGSDRQREEKKAEFHGKTKLEGSPVGHSKQLGGKTRTPKVGEKALRTPGKWKKKKTRKRLKSTG